VAAAGALAAVLTLVATATAEVELSLRGEGRSIIVGAPPASAPGPSAESRTSVMSASLTPRVAFAADGAPGRLVASYSAFLWTQDVGAASGLLVNHGVDARAELGREGPWRAVADVSGTLGMSEPLSAPPGSAGVSQYASAGPLHYQALGASARGELQRDRTTTGLTLSGAESSGMGPAARGVMPLQRTAGAAASTRWAATEVDTLVLSLDASRTWTEAGLGAVVTSYAGTHATWRRGLSPSTEGWVGAGASVSSSSGGGSLSMEPSAEVGFLQAGASTQQRTVARLTVYVDRFTGTLSPMAQASWSLRWTAADRWGVAGTTSVAGTDTGTVLAALDLRTTWAVRDRLAFETGALARWQRDPRPEIPSFFEVGVFLAVSQATTFRVASGP